MLAPSWLLRAAPLTLVGGFVALGVASALLVPWDATQGPLRERTPPDEAAHLAYVRHLATERSLPVFESAHGAYESHQPPLYYALSVPAYAATAWAGPGAAYHAVRLFSVAIGGCLVYLVWLLMRRLFPDELGVPLAATAMAAFLPMHVAILSAITNDGLAELACTAVLYVSCVGLSEGFTDRRIVGLGALLGVGALVKTGCLLFAPVALLAVALRMQRRRLDIVRLLRQWGLCLLACLVVCGWWLVRNTQLYGDPLAMGVFKEVFLARDAARATPDWFFERGASLGTYVGLVAVWTWCSFWGVLGQANQFMPAWFYALGGVLTVWAAVGWMTRTWRGIRVGIQGQTPKSSTRGPGRSRRIQETHGPQVEQQQVRGFRCQSPNSESLGETVTTRPVVSVPEFRQMLLLLGLSLAIVFIAFVQFNMEFFQAQARYLFPAIAPIACFFALGWREVVPLRWRTFVLAAVAACLLGMSVCALAPGLASGMPPFAAL